MTVVEKIQQLQKNILRGHKVLKGQWKSVRNRLHHQVTDPVWKRLCSGLAFYKGNSEGTPQLKVLPGFFHINHKNTLHGIESYNKAISTRSNEKKKYDNDKLALLPNFYIDQDASIEAARLEWERQRIVGKVQFPLVHEFYSESTVEKRQKEIILSFRTSWTASSIPSIAVKTWNNKFGKERATEATKIHTTETRKTERESAAGAHKKLAISTLHRLTGAIASAQSTLDRVDLIKTGNINVDGHLPAQLSKTRGRIEQTSVSSSSSSLSSSTADLPYIAAHIAAAQLSTAALSNNIGADFLEELHRIARPVGGHLLAAARLLRGSQAEREDRSYSESERRSIGLASMLLTQHALGLDSVSNVHEVDMTRNVLKLFENSVTDMEDDHDGLTPLSPRMISISPPGENAQTAVRMALDTVASAATPSDVVYLFKTCHGGAASLIEEERKTNAVQSYVRNGLLQRTYGQSTKTMWDAQLRKAAEELLHHAEVENVNVPSATVASKLISRPDLETVTMPTSGAVFVHRKNFREHMEFYLEKIVKKALFNKFKGQSTVHLPGIVRADATNVTKGSTSRDPHMMTVFFLDIGSSIGLGNDGISQQQFAVGDVNDHVEFLEEYMSIYLAKLDTIFSTPFFLEHEGEQMSVHIDFGLFVADGRLLRDITGHFVHGWKFLNPYHSIPAADVYKGNFSSWNGRNKAEDMDATTGDERVYSDDMTASFMLYQATSHTNKTMHEVTTKYQDIATAEFGINPNGSLLSNLCDMDGTMNDSWHGIVTGNKGTFHKILVHIFKATKQLYSTGGTITKATYVTHYENCERIPMTYKNSKGIVEVRVDGGDRLKLDLISPQRSPVVCSCPTCGLYLNCTDRQRTILYSWIRACHWIACFFSTQSKQKRDLLLPIIRKIAFLRDELTALITTPEFGGATPSLVSNQIIDAAFTLKERIDEVLGSVDQERMENHFKYVKDFNRQGNGGGGGDASAAAHGFACLTITVPLFLGNDLEMVNAAKISL